MKSLILLFFTASIAACGGGGGPAVVPAVLRIEVAGAAAPLYVADAPPPASVADIRLNATLRFICSGPVDPMSLPADGPALGSITITTELPGSAVPTVSFAEGRWSIDAADPNTAVFTPLAPAHAANVCDAGLRSDAACAITVNAPADGAAPALRIAGQPIVRSASARFTTVACQPADPAAAYVDDGLAPIVVATEPPMSAAAPLVAKAALAASGNGIAVTLDINEAILPSTVTAAAFALFNVSANAHVAFRIETYPTAFVQKGWSDSPFTRISITTRTMLADGDIFELRSNDAAPLLDLGGHPLVIPPGALRFTVANENDDQDFAFFDDFTGVLNLSVTSGDIRWTGDGAVRATFLDDIAGSGADGAASILTSQTLNTNTNGACSTARR